MHTRTYAHAHMRTHARTHVRTRTRTRARTHVRTVVCSYSHRASRIVGPGIMAHMRCRFIDTHTAPRETNRVHHGTGVDDACATLAQRHMCGAGQIAAYHGTGVDATYVAPTRSHMPQGGSKKEKDEIAPAWPSIEAHTSGPWL